MSCSSCCRSYGLFLKEHGCPICRMSFCSRCLAEKLPVPVLGGKKMSVCRKCYNKATTIEDEAPPLLPPEALKRQLEDLDNPARPPITVYRQSSRAASLKRGLSHQDSELVDRLEALKADRKAKHAPTESEVAGRLAALKGTPSTAGQARRSNLPSEERRSTVAQEHDLMDQARDEIRIAGKYRPEEGLQERLNRLRGVGDDAPQEAAGAEAPPSGADLPACTDGQTAAELLQAVQAEVGAEIRRADQIASKVAHIGQRLEEVRGAAQRRRSQEAAAGEPSEDASPSGPSEEEEVQKLIAQIKDEAVLEDKEIDEELESLSSDGEELPWCCICNADATVRCRGCSGDLYCRSCFRTGHQSDLRDHEYTPFPEAK